MQAHDVINKLGLQPLDPEGGFFLQTYKSSAQIAAHGGQRSLATSIYYLITPTSFSRFHRLRSTEIYHFYAGDAAQLTMISPDGKWTSVILGNDLMAGQIPQIVVPANTWQAIRISGTPKNAWSLLGTTVSPGFEFGDFEMAKKSSLLKDHPESRKLIDDLSAE